MQRRRFCTLSITAFGLDAEEGRAISARRIWAAPDTNLLGGPSLDGRYLSFVDGAGGLAIHDLARGENHRLTANRDPRQFAYFSAISPGSRLAAYAWFNEDKFYDLRVIELDGSAMRVLFRNQEAGFVQPCAWSPDGNQILTLLFRKDNSSQIALIPAAGGPARAVKSLSWVYPRKMDFSPDGRYIAHDESGREDSAGSSIYVLAADGSLEVMLVADALFPVWTRDGKRVLFASGRDGSMGLWSIAVSGGKANGQPQLVKRDLGRFLPMGITGAGVYYYGLRTGSSEVRVADIETENPASQSLMASSSAPEWSPDGLELAALTRVGPENFGQESRVISILTLASGRTRVVAPKLAYLDRIRWSPDGRELLVGGSDRSARRGLFRVDARTGATSPVLREGVSTYRGLEGVWAAGGKAILYIHDDAIHRNDEELFRGANLHELAITSDGQWLAFVASSMDKDALVVMPATGGDSRQLASVPKGGISGVEWMRDNRHLLISTPNKPVAALWRVSLEGGRPERLPIALDRQAGVRLHPDGRRVAFTWGATQSEVWSMPLGS